MKTWRCVYCGSVIPADDRICDSCLKNSRFVTASVRQEIEAKRSQTQKSDASVMRPRQESGAKQPQAQKSDATSFGGKTEVIWLSVIGLASATAFITSLVKDFSHPVIWVTGVLAAVFALPFALTIVAVVLVGLLQAFTPGGGSALPLFGWKGGVDGLSPVERSAFGARPPMVRFTKVYLWLACNSLMGALATLVAFAALYVFMQFAQQKNH